MPRKKTADKPVNAGKTTAKSAAPAPQASSPTRLVRIKPHNPKRGFLVKSYTFRGHRFVSGAGWYEVPTTFGEELAALRQTDDPHAPPVFDVVTAAEAEEIDSFEAMSEEGKRAATDPDQGVMSTKQLPRSPDKAIRALKDAEARAQAAERRQAELEARLAELEAAGADDDDADDAGADDAGADDPDPFE